MSAGLALVLFVILSLVVDGVMANWEAKRYIERKRKEEEQERKKP